MGYFEYTAKFTIEYDPENYGPDEDPMAVEEATAREVLVDRILDGDAEVTVEWKDG